MPEIEASETDEIETETENTDTDEVSEDTVDTADEGQGDADSGLKKALAAERKQRREFERELKQVRQQLADKDKPAEEAAIEQARRDAEQAVLERANDRIRRAELKAAAATKVKRPDLLLKVTDLSAIEVDENGDPDVDAINDAIATFLEEYPELAADASKFSGSADQGAKGKQTQPRQLTREQIKSMTPEQIVEAQSKGLLNGVLGGKA